ncbi:DUF2141 domain-containing protein [Bacteroidota bacterium]
MKTLVISILFMLFTLLSFGQSGSIVVEINGCENSNGGILLGLYNSESGFLEFDKSYKGAFVKANKGTVLHTFTAIPAGKYALAVWHDEDENKKLDKNIIGVPKEKYGFSNNRFGKFGPPDFNEASFKVEDNKKTTLIINLK